MRNLFIILPGLFLITSIHTRAGDTILANKSLIEYTGRIDFSNPLAPTFSYSGISIRACFTGTSIAMIMDDDVGQNYYNLILDDKLLDTVRIMKGKKTYSIAEGLENKIHEIEIFKRTEEMFGKTRFFGFVVDKGTILTPISNKKEKLIEYIGNSITCGYGNEGINGGTFGPTTENHYMTYAAFTSRNFNARHLAVSRSGIGIYRNYNGPKAGNPDCMPNYYNRIFLYDEVPKYSFADKPDLVCINLGTNDFSTTGGDSALYVNNYFRFIDTIQAKYTMPDILCLLGSMLSGTSLTKVRDYLKFIADSANRKGKGNVYFFEMSQQTGTLGIGIDYHPTVAQHEKNGLELTEYVKSMKGWKIHPLILKANLTETRHMIVEFNTPVIDTLNGFNGFKIHGDDLEYAIDNVYRDSINSRIIHIRLQQSLDPGRKIKLFYSPGTILSEDSILVGAIDRLDVQNLLTETKVLSGTTNKGGSLITLTFNKNVNVNSSLAGFTLTDNNQGIIEIDSFGIKNNVITLYLKETIQKGQSVFASYSGTGILGIDNIPLSGFENLVIENKSVYLGVSVNKKNSFIIFPNPNKTGIFNYQMDESMKWRDEVSYEIIKLDGTKISKGLISTAEGQIDLQGNWSEGIYYLNLRFGENAIAKFIIME